VLDDPQFSNHENSENKSGRNIEVGVTKTGDSLICGIIF